MLSPTFVSVFLAVELKKRMGGFIFMKYTA